MACKTWLSPSCVVDPSEVVAIAALRTSVAVHLRSGAVLNVPDPRVETEPERAVSEMLAVLAAAGAD